MIYLIITHFLFILGIIKSIACERVTILFFETFLTKILHIVPCQISLPLLVNYLEILIFYPYIHY